MKIVHTADWHLCDKLHRVPRTDDLRSRVRTVAAICEEEMADVLVIAGDLFSDQTDVTVERMTDELDHLQKVFDPFFRRKGTILAVTGNHDKDGRIEMVRVGMRLGSVPHQGGPLAPGRMYLQNGPGVCVLGTGDDRVQFVLVPYPHYPRYSDPADSFTSSDERNRVVQTRVGQWVQTAQSRPGFEMSLPSVLVAHLHVRGAATHTLYRLSERDDVTFEAGFVPSHWAYVALGHIHKPQCLGAASHIRYPGPLDRLDFGECDDDRGVIVVEIGKRCGPDCRTEPRWVAITPTPMREIVIADPAEVEFLADKHPDRETAIVKITVTLTSGGPSRDELARELTKIFPRYAEIRFERPGSADGDGDASRVGIRAQADYRATVREYLRREDVIAADHPHRDELLSLADTFLTSPKANT